MDSRISDGPRKGKKFKKKLKRGFQKNRTGFENSPTPGEPRFASGVGGVEEVKSGGFLL